jgi:hypothetical protein
MYIVNDKYVNAKKPHQSVVITIGITNAGLFKNSYL